jgi:hypothetical protein
MRRQSLSVVILNALCYLLWLSQQQLCHAQLTTTPTTHDMRAIAGNACFGMWAKPGEIFTVPVFVDLAKVLESDSNFQNDVGVSLSSMTTVSMMGVMAPSLYNESRIEPVPLASIRIQNPQQFSIFKSKVLDKTEKLAVPEIKQELYTRRYEWDKEKKDSWLKERNVSFILDNDTFVTAQYGQSMKALLLPEKSDQKPRWSEHVSKFSGSHAAAAIDGVQFRELMKNEIAKRPPRAGMEALIVMSFMNILDSADVGYISATYKDGINVTGVAISADEASAKQFKGSLDGLIGLGKGFLPVLKAQIEGLKQFPPEETKQIYVDIEATVNSLKVTQSGKETTIEIQASAAATKHCVSLITALIKEDFERREKYRKEFEERRKKLEEQSKQTQPEDATK